MSYTLVSVPIIDPDFRSEENWDQMEMDSYHNSILIGELCAEFDAVKSFTTDRQVRTQININGKLPSGKGIEGFTNHAMRKGLVAFIDPSEAKKFVIEYLERSKGVCIPEVTEVRDDFNFDDWGIS